MAARGTIVPTLTGTSAQFGAQLWFMNRAILPHCVASMLVRRKQFCEGLMCGVSSAVTRVKH